MDDTELEVLLPGPPCGAGACFGGRLKPGLVPQLRSTSFWRSGADLLISVSHVFHLSRFGIDVRCTLRDRPFRRPKKWWRDCYSARNALSGLTWVARRAGRKQASMVAPVKIKAARPSERGSHGFT